MRALRGFQPELSQQPYKAICLPGMVLASFLESSAWKLDFEFLRLFRNRIKDKRKSVASGAFLFRYLRHEIVHTGVESDQRIAC